MKSFVATLLMTLCLAGGIYVISSENAFAATTKTSLTLSNGATYYGEVLNGKPHGKGTANWGEHKTYTGSWKHGKRSGKGKYVASTPEMNKVVYDGSWTNDKQNGQGTLREYFTYDEYAQDYQKISAFKGTFKDNQPLFGYSVIRDYNANAQLGFRYLNKDVLVAFAVAETDDFKTQLKAEKMPLLAYVNFKKETGFLIQYSADHKNYYQYGTFKKLSNGSYSFYDGKMEMFDTVEETYLLSDVKKAKIANQKFKIFTESLYDYRERLINKNLYVLTPYLNSFRKLYNEL